MVIINHEMDWYADILFRKHPCTYFKNDPNSIPPKAILMSLDHVRGVFWFNKFVSVVTMIDKFHGDYVGTRFPLA